MKETPEVKSNGAQGSPSTENGGLSEENWQKWLRKNKERDSVRRKKLIRLLLLVLPSVLLGAIIWWLNASK